MAGKRVHFVMPAGLVERVDAALPEGVSRGEFVRRAVERALDGLALGKGGEHESATASPPPASAEQPVRESIPRAPVSMPAPSDVPHVTSSGARRPFSPYPKGGKR